MDTPQNLADWILNALKQEKIEPPFTKHDVHGALRGAGHNQPDSLPVSEALDVLRDRLVIHSPDTLSEAWFRPFEPSNGMDMLKLAEAQADPAPTAHQRECLRKMISDGSRVWRPRYGSKRNHRATAESLERRGVLEYREYGPNDPRNPGFYATGRFGELMRIRASMG